MNSSSSKYIFTKSNYQTIRIVLITSLFWVFVDAFLIIYLTDCDCSRFVVPCSENKEIKQKEPLINKELRLNPDLNKHRQSVSTSYQFSSKNERHGFLNKLKVWFKEKPSSATNPPSWPGENGKGAVIPAKLKAEAEKRFKENQFNIVASELIALNRSVPDQRSQM
jgi:hypothetical protein